MSFTPLSQATRTARKQHRCIWCGEAIAAGQKYADERSIYDRNFQHHRFHPECKEACQEEASEWGGEFEFMPHDNERPIKEQQP